MKNLKLSLFSTIIFFFAIPSHAVVLDQAFITKKAVSIEAKIKQDRYIMYGLTGFAIAYGIYQWMPMMTTVMVSKPALPVVIEIKPDNAENQKTPEKFFVIQSVKNGMQKIKDGTCEVFHDLFCTKESWLSFLQYTLSLTGAGIINQVTEKFMHPDTLRWYIHNHVPYYTTIKLMKERIVGVQDPLVDVQEQKVNNRMLLLLQQRLMRQAHAMCAYIEYKIKNIDQAEKGIAQEAQQSIIKIHEEFLADIKRELSVENPDFTKIELLLDTYQDQLDLFINHFALSEGETKKERAASKK